MNKEEKGVGEEARRRKEQSCGRIRHKHRGTRGTGGKRQRRIIIFVPTSVVSCLAHCLQVNRRTKTERKESAEMRARAKKGGRKSEKKRFITKEKKSKVRGWIVWDDREKVESWACCGQCLAMHRPTLSACLWCVCVCVVLLPQQLHALLPRLGPGPRAGQADEQR